VLDVLKSSFLIDKMVFQYIVVKWPINTSNTPVESYLNDGWISVGGVSMVVLYNGNPYYIQAMMKKN